MEDDSSAKEREHLDTVIKELSRYEHPMFEWEARPAPPGVDVVIWLKIPGVYEDAYRLHLKPREIESRRFEWDFQRQMYNCLHDYLVEMFIRSPHIAEL